MKNSRHEQLLEQKGLKKTKVRMALLQHFLNLDHAQSYSDLKFSLKGEIDKSTLYRNLTSFEQAGIIHRINDHTGTSKYAFGELPNGSHNHAHFVCETCETVYCMEVPTPIKLNVPEGFQTNKVQTIIKGVCAKCCPLT